MNKEKRQLERMKKMDDSFSLKQEKNHDGIKKEKGLNKNIKDKKPTGIRIPEEEFMKIGCILTDKKSGEISIINIIDED